MTPLTDNGKDITKNKNNVTYAKKSFVSIKAMKANIKYTKKLEIIVITRKI